MPDTVDDHLFVIEEDDVAVLAHDLDDQVVGAKIAHFIAVFHFEAQDPFQSGLGDRDDAAVLQMLAQKHAESRRLKRCLAAGPGQVDQGEGRICAQIETDLTAALFCRRADGDHQLVLVCLRDFINTPAADGVLQLAAKTGDGDSVKSHVNVSFLKPCNQYSVTARIS